MDCFELSLVSEGWKPIISPSLAVCQFSFLSRHQSSHSLENTCKSHSSQKLKALTRGHWVFCQFCQFCFLFFLSPRQGVTAVCPLHKLLNEFPSSETLSCLVISLFCHHTQEGSGDVHHLPCKRLFQCRSLGTSESFLGISEADHTTIPGSVACFKGLSWKTFSLKGAIKAVAEDCCGRGAHMPSIFEPCMYKSYGCHSISCDPFVTSFPHARDLKEDRLFASLAENKLLLARNLPLLALKTCPWFLWVRSETSS